MFFNVLAIVLGLMGLAVFLMGLRILLRRGWVLGWLRGMAGVAFLLLAFTVGLLAIDLRSYKPMQTHRDSPIATVSFEKLGNQHYRAIYVPTDASPTQQFDLQGDQWQLDARILRWRGLLRTIGGKPGYRLDRISGRYLSLEDDRFRERTTYSLGPESSGLDFWAWVERQQNRVPWVAASYSSATFMPMAEGALFEILLSTSGLIAKPLNAPARQALYYGN